MINHIKIGMSYYFPTFKLFVSNSCLGCVDHLVFFTDRMISKHSSFFYILSLGRFELKLYSTFYILIRTSLFIPSPIYTFGNSSTLFKSTVAFFWGQCIMYILSLYYCAFSFSSLLIISFFLS